MAQGVNSASSAAYEPKAVEADWYAWWESKGFFTPPAPESGVKDTQPDRKFVMVIPPPNVTGYLHLGHGLTSTIEDTLTRWHRMRGDVTLWLPGCDHAGIATQSVVERLLYRTEGKTRHDLSREDFLKKVWEWKEMYGSRIYEQQRRIGASVDWTRARFTMDASMNKAVVEAFVQFFEQGRIYRANRLVNWCPHLRTALSDLEVDYQEIAGRTLLKVPGLGDARVEVGVMNHFKYKVKGSDETITVATTRLETMLGDVAVAVHPDDARYKHLVGKELEHPFFPDRKVVVVADIIADPELGTGCVKITPAHDPNDYLCGQRQGLPSINILDEDGHMNALGGPFARQHRFVARRNVEEKLKELGLFVEKKSHAMRLGVCSRSGDIIEPYLKPQWYMDCKELAAQALEKAETGELKIVPEVFVDTWRTWLTSIRDWCISRQLVWGHQIPAYKVVEPAQEQEVWVVGRTPEEAEAKAKEKLGVASVKLERDADVLDTWFSAGLFPFSVFGWPDKTADLEAFFPTTLLETGHDILFFWVARMVMMSLGLINKLPFSTVYLHAMVRDAHGRKMSKSLGNVIDPIEVIEGISLEKLYDKLQQGNLPANEIEKAKKGQKEDYPNGIPECGTDALRFGLLAYTVQARSLNLNINRVVGYRHFCNKLWNIVKFALSKFPADFQPSGLTNLALKGEDLWILSRLSYAAGAINTGLETYAFADATTAAYNFWLYDLADRYLEIVKPRTADAADAAVVAQVLYICLDQGLRLMHPLMPFVTEELYQRLPKGPSSCESVCIAPYPLPVVAWRNEALEAEFAYCDKVVHGIRAAMSSLQLTEKHQLEGFVSVADEQAADAVSKHLHVVRTLSRLGSASMVAAGSAQAGCIKSVVDEKTTAQLKVAGLVDVAAEVGRAQKKTAETNKLLESYKKKTQIPNYDTKVPEAVRVANTEKIEALTKQLQELQDAITALQSLTA